MFHADRTPATKPADTTGPVIQALAGSPGNLQHSTASQLGMANAASAISDRSGGYYIAATSANVVYHVTSAGAVSIVVGNGVATDAGDGGPAANASVEMPGALALDNLGNLYIGTVSHIRVINTSGVISTFDLAGEVFALAVDNSGNVYAAEEYDPYTGYVDAVVRTSGFGNYTLIAGVSGDCSAGGCMVTGKYLNPIGLALSGQNLYIADDFMHEIDDYNIGSYAFTVVAGNGKCTFSGDGGAATSAALCNPYGLGVDSAGNIYIDDSGNARIRYINVTTGQIETLAGDGTPGYGGDGGAATSAHIYAGAYSGIMPVSAQQFAFLDRYNNRIRVVSNGTIETSVGDGNANFGGDSAGAVAASLLDPHGIATDASNNIFIADSGNNRIRRVDAKTGFITTVAGNGGAGSSGDGGSAAAAMLQPGFLAFDASGNLYATDLIGRSVRRIDVATGTISTYADGFYTPRGLAFTKDGSLFVADDAGCVVWKVAADGSKAIFAGEQYNCGESGTGVATSVLLSYPIGIATDPSGNVYVADSGNDAVRKITPTGQLSNAAGIPGEHGEVINGENAKTSALGNPYGVHYANGFLYIADTSAHAGYQVQLSSGTLTVLAGTDVSGYTVPGVATDTKLVSPGDLLPDGFGNFYLTDYADNVLTRIHTSPIASALVLQASKSVVTPGASATLTATVSVPPLGTYATGNVTFSTNGLVIGQASLSKGVAMLTASTAGVPVGVYPVVATYSGDALYAAGTSNTLQETVGISTATTLTANPAAAPQGSSVTLTAVVKDSSGNTVSAGTVSFYAAGELLQTVSAASGQFVLKGSTAGYPKGTYAVDAVYSGSGSDLTSTSKSVSVTIQ